jgi:hypothetical protein
MKTLSLSLLSLLTIGLVACGPSSQEDPNTATDEATAAATATATADMPPPEETAAPATTATATATATAEAPKADAPKPTKSFALAEFKLPLTIDLPEDAKVEASKSKDGLGGATVDAKDVSIRISKADARIATVAAAKATLQKLKVGAAKSFVKEEADLLVYTIGDGSSYEFLVLSKQAGVTYGCQSLGSEPSEAKLQAAITACRSLKKG